MSLMRPDGGTELLKPSSRPLTKHPFRHRFFVALTVFLVLAVMLVGAGGVYVAIQNGRVQKIGSLNKPVGNLEAAIPQVVSKDEPVNILVVGNDSRSFAKDAKDRAEFGARTVESQRSDTMMVIRLDPRNDRAAILSIARDLYVELDGGGRGRINEAFSRKDDSTKPDPGRLIRTIRSSFGITVNHYIEIDFAGFRQVVNAIGGVNVYFPFPARDQFSLLRIDRTGCVQLDGAQALSYVRSRHYEFNGPKGWQFDSTGDIGRIQRQQDFIRRVLRKAVADGLTNPITATKLIEAGIDNVKVDGGFGVGDMKDLANQLRGLDDGKVAFIALTGDPANVDGADVLNVNPTKTTEALAAFGAFTAPLTTATTAPPSGSDPSISC